MRFNNYLMEKRKGFVGLFPGRLSGVTKAHKRIIDVMSKNSDDCYMLLVKGKGTTGDKKNPFPLHVQADMIKKILPSNCHLKIVNSAFLPDIVGEIPGEKFAVYSGPDRVKGYRAQIKYFDEVGKELIVYDIGKMLGGMTRGEFSGTQLRNSLKNDDFKEFKHQAPPQLHKEFDKLRKYF